MIQFCILSLLLFVQIPASATELSDADVELFEALKEEDADAASAALRNGANINALSPRGSQTPLMQSVLHGRMKMVKWALENGADVTIGEKDGYTPMHGAGFQGRSEIAQLLKDHGVGLREKHADGYEPASESKTCLWSNDCTGLTPSILRKFGLAGALRRGTLRQ